MDAVGVTVGVVDCDRGTLFDLLRQFNGTLHPAGTIGQYGVIREEVVDPPSFRTALYVICDDACRVLYVGQCRRTTSGVDDRLFGHNALSVGGAESTADSVFIVPLCDHLAGSTVDAMEATLIAAFHPPYNVQRVVRRAS